MSSSTKTASPLLRRRDRIGALIFVVTLVAALILAVALPSLVDGLSYYLSFAMIALPFIAVGVWDSAASGRWLQLVVSIVICALLYLVDWRVSAAALILLVGAQGVPAAADMAQRRWLPDTLDSMERCGADGSRRCRFTAFMIGVPPGTDTRNIRINSTVTRDRFPWGQMARSMMPALILMLLVWMFAAASSGFRADLWNNILLLLAISLYAAAFSVCVFILGTLDVRIGRAGSTFRPFYGLFDTLCKMALPAIVALIVILYAVDPGWGALIATVASAVFCLALLLLSMLSYMLNDERALVGEVWDAWTDSHPAEFDSGFDGKGSGHPLDDGVPGTPRRPEDFCFDRMKY